MFRNLSGMVVVGFLLTSCASVPRDQAMALADTGDQATSVILAQLQRVSASASRQIEINAFVKTMDYCGALPEDCKAQLPSDALAAQYSKLAGLTASRIKAVAALNKAYDALAREAEYDARGVLGGAISDLANTTNTYTSLALAGVGGGAGLAVSQVVGELAPQAVGIFAGNQQAERLRMASKIIGEATANLSDALAAETVVYESFLEVWTRKENEMRVLLLQAGLTSRAEILAPLADSIGVPIGGGAKSIIKRSQALSTAVEAIATAQTQRRQQASVAAYQSAVRALRNLSAAHKNFDNFRQSDLDKVIWALDELNAAVDSLDGAQ